MNFHEQLTCNVYLFSCKSLSQAGARCNVLFSHVTDNSQFWLHVHDSGSAREEKMVLEGIHILK